MTDGNGKEGEEGVTAEVRVKMCPFLKEWCTKDVADRCVLHQELTRERGGLREKMGMCAFNAITVILLELKEKIQPSPLSTIQLPKGVLGR